MKKLITLTALLTFSMGAYSANSTIFSCTTTQGNDVKVVQSGKDYILTYKSKTIKNSIKQVLNSPNSTLDVGSGFIGAGLEFTDNNQKLGISYTEPRGNKKGNYKNLVEPSFYIGEKYESCDQTKKIVYDLPYQKMKSTGL